MDGVFGAKSHVGNPAEHTDRQGMLVVFIIVLCISIAGLLGHLNRIYKLLCDRRDFDADLKTTCHWITTALGILCFLEAIIATATGMALIETDVTLPLIVCLVTSCGGSLALLSAHPRTLYGYIPYVTSWLKNKEEKRMELV